MGDRRALKKKEKDLIRTISNKIAKVEKINDDKATLKKAKSKEKLSGKPYSSPEIAKLNKEIAELNDRLREIRKAQKKRRNLLERIRDDIQEKTTQIRNSRKPKIINLNLEFKPMTTQGSVDKVIGHYTAGPRDENTKDAIRLCKLYHQSHLNQGWSGEAYMLCFTSDGNILLLRPSKYVGAHTLGYNTGSYGIMMHGTTGDKATPAQKRALRWWANNGDKAIMKSGQTKIKPKNIKWYGHNDFNATSCPGEFKETYTTKGNK